MWYACFEIYTACCGINSEIGLNQRGHQYFSPYPKRF
jgi:hypothetical protein